MWLPMCPLMYPPERPPSKPGAYPLGIVAGVNIDFHASERSSLGIEMELEIIDRASRQLTSAASEILAAMADSRGGEEPRKAKHELMENTIEINTDVCATVAEARADLQASIAGITTHTEPRGLALMCSGTHPFSHWVHQKITPNPRYERLVEQMQWPARQLLIFGIHVHVGVRSAEKAIAISNALTGYIPHFLALSASSPFWLGQDTGLASSRSKIFEHLPTAGIPYQLSGWSEFEEFMSTLVAARSIETIREVWWDVRPHPDFGTVELRICDGLPTLSEVAAIGALSQCLVEWMDNLCDRGFALPHPRQWIIRENKWRAARYGVDAQIIVDEGGELVPVRRAVEELVEELGPIASRLACVDELHFVLDILKTGPSYVRQRAMANETGNLQGVVDALVTELETDTPLLVGGLDP
ncbi:MAG: glutamate---cysteine ligase / carboxylate-amine ligase [Actinomycetota bacterium]|nr:glutamate---cysteine ligase / carboxylate-amine ligase [Actinomycetota bacterium]